MALFIEFLYTVVFFDAFCHEQLERFAVVPIAAPQYQKKCFLDLLHFKVLFKCLAIRRYSSLMRRLSLHLGRTQTRLAQILNREINHLQLSLLVEA
jgi:hypothetical protein